MDEPRIINSLKLKGLFGEYNIDLEFNDITVIVGKNGLGKTTLLKIINGLITGKDPINYAAVCDSIELNFTDGNTITYGCINDELAQHTVIEELPSYVTNDSARLNALMSSFKGATDFSEDEKIKFAKLFLETILNTNEAKKLISNKFEEFVMKNNNRIFARKKHREFLKKNIIVRYISTVNISANANNSMDIGNSVEKNILDLAIYDELRPLLISKNKNVISLFINEINGFLSESGKNAKITKNELKFISKAGKTLGINQLSSGERQLVYILATAANTYGKKTLFLMDEPEVSLHLDWQEKLLDSIRNINKQMQIIAVTHSPGIIMSGHMDAYIDMRDIMEEIYHG